MVSPGAATASGSGVWAEAAKTDADKQKIARPMFRSATMSLLRNIGLAIFCLSASVLAASAQTPLPDAVAAPGETIVLTLHAEGAQVYECKAASDGKLAW